MKIPIYLFLSLMLVALMSSCNKDLEIGLKSSKPEEIIPLAKKFYERGKYDHASSLFDHAKKFVYGTDYAKDVDYYSALTSLKAKNYALAAQEFSTYAMRYRTDSLAEESQYMGAYCYYLGSNPYNLDPQNTKSAISELQKFINLYPNSDKVTECNDYIEELHVRLEKKAFENARTLYKIAKYPSASVAFDNVIDDFPDTDYKEEALYYSFLSKAEYALMSYDHLKEDRFNTAMTTYKLLKKGYPNSEYLKESNKVVEKIEKEYADLEEKENIANNNSK